MITDFLLTGTDTYKLTYVIAGLQGFVAYNWSKSNFVSLYFYRYCRSGCIGYLSAVNGCNIFYMGFKFINSKKRKDNGTEFFRAFVVNFSIRFSIGFSCRAECVTNERD